MIEAVPSTYLVPFDGSFRLEGMPCHPGDAALDRVDGKQQLRERVRRFSELQKRLMAEDRQSLLLIFQAMDAAGKDGTIRATTSGVNPAGFQVSAFKVPSAGELDHDFLWRSARQLPQRGRIGIFNRSYYEEVIEVRVHPEYLDAQRLRDCEPNAEFWEQRFQSIREHELHLARNGTTVIKFFLNVSLEAQARRLLRRIDDADRNWKFSATDIRKRDDWAAYTRAYEAAMAQTSLSCAPWYAIPADHKPNTRLLVADIIVRTLERMDPQYPNFDPTAREKMMTMRQHLVSGPKDSDS